MSPLARDMTQEALIDVCRSQSDEANRCTLMYSSVMFFSFVVPANFYYWKFDFFLKVGVSREIGDLWGHKISLDKFLKKGSLKRPKEFISLSHISLAFSFTCHVHWSPLARDMTQEALIDVCRSQSDEANRCTLIYSSVMFFSFVVPANLPRTKFIIGNFFFFESWCI